MAKSSKSDKLNILFIMGDDGAARRDLAEHAGRCLAGPVHHGARARAL